MPKTMDELLTPIWDAEMGKRLSVARMSILLDQKGLAGLLGVSTSVITRLEQGKLRTPEKPFSLHQLKAVFPKLTSYILLGTNEENMPRNFYVARYWRERMKPKYCKLSQVEADLRNDQYKKRA